MGRQLPSIKLTKPRDPEWAPAGALSRLRKAIALVDPRLDVWWSTRDERWVVMERLRSRDTWTYVFAIAQEDGSYRHPDGVEAWVLDRLKRADWWAKYGHRFSAPMGEIHAEEDSYDAEKAASHRAEKEYLLKHAVGDYIERGEGIRQTFGPGGHRGRGFRHGDSSHVLREAAESLPSAH